MWKKRFVSPINSAHNAHWKALSTVYFTSQEVVGPVYNAKCVNSIVEFIFNESLCEKRDLWVLQTVHSAYWKALSTVYFASQEVVGSVYSAQNPLTDVMECFSV